MLERPRPIGPVLKVAALGRRDAGADEAPGPAGFVNSARLSARRRCPRPPVVAPEESPPHEVLTENHRRILGERGKLLAHKSDSIPQITGVVSSLLGGRSFSTWNHPHDEASPARVVPPCAPPVPEYARGVVLGRVVGRRPGRRPFGSGGGSITDGHHHGMGAARPRTRKPVQPPKTTTRR